MSDDQPTPDLQPDEQQSDSDALGDAGKAAIKAERERANSAEKALRALQAEFDTTSVKAAALEQAQQESAAALAAKDLAITRLTVGLDKGLPKALISRLQGDDEASIAADADELMKIMPAPASSTFTPRPDPSQGAKAPAATSLEAQFAAALGPVLNRN